MSPYAVKRRINQIKAEADDPELAHIDEDSLRADVLKSIIETSTDPISVELAKLALSTSKIDFSRWYA